MSTVFKFVNGCGKHHRTIFRIGNQVHIGCFQGSYKRAEAQIIAKYGSHSKETDQYLEKLNKLKTGGDPWSQFPWKEYSYLVARHRPDKFDPLLFNWAAASLAVAMSCPDHIDPEQFDWTYCSYIVVMHCPEQVVLSKLN